MGRAIRFCGYIIIILFTGFYFSCGHAETKVKQPTETDTNSTGRNNNANRPGEENLPGSDGSATKTSNDKPTHDDILANIDQYLVSTPIFPTPAASGGIVNASVNVKNTLADITIQKAIVEVSILTKEGAEFRTDYHILLNIEPGEVETVKVPNAAKGNSIVSHIVKLKSAELTNGELVLVGHRISPK